MIKVNTRHIILYLTGIVLLIFGYPGFWDKITEANQKKNQAIRIRHEAKEASSKPFEVQQLELDTVSNTWKNKHLYFQTVHVGQINFKAVRIAKKSTIETNDDENASDSF